MEHVYKNSFALPTFHSGMASVNFVENEFSGYDEYCDMICNNIAPNR